MTRHPLLTLTTRSGWRCAVYLEAHPSESKTEALARVMRRLALSNPPTPALEAVTARGHAA